jgi:uncharacterized protein (DUF433 family)
MSTQTEAIGTGVPLRDLPDFLTREKDGEIRLTGHRIGLYSVVDRCRQGRSAEQIQAEFPSLRLSQVYRVLAFYLDNQAEVDALVDAYRAEIDRQAASTPGPGVEKVRALMGAEPQRRG